MKWSASKIVFMMMGLSVVYLTANGTVEAKDFVILATMAFVHYFKRSSTEQHQTNGKP